MKRLGLNPMEQEVVDLTNTITRNGFIYFPDFCKIVLKRWREEDEEIFRQNLFKVRACQPAYHFSIQSPDDSCSLFFAEHLRHGTIP